MTPEDFRVTLDTAAKLKKFMLERGLRVSEVACPKCDGHIRGRLAGTKNHLHMYCDGPCEMTLME